MNPEALPCMAARGGGMSSSKGGLEQHMLFVLSCPGAGGQHTNGSCRRGGGTMALRHPHSTEGN